MSERSNASIAKECPQLPAEKERPQLLGGEALI